MSVLNLISYFFRINNDSDYFLLKTIMIVQSSHSISNMATAASFYSFFLILSWCADVSEREGGIQKRGEFLAVVLSVNVIYKANETNLCIQCMYIVKYVRLLYL